MAPAIRQAPDNKPHAIDGIEPAFLRPEEAGKALGISRAKVYKMWEAGELQGLIVGARGLRIPRRAIDALIERAMTAAAE